jgi:flagellar basal-body rod modification protein FlgD
MSIDATRLAAATGLIDRQARIASATATAAARTSSASGSSPVDLNGTTSIKGDSNAISDAFGMTSDDFLTLFLAQLTNQDPTQPMDDKEMLAQLAQFTMISTLNDVQKSLGGSQLANASALIGDQVIGTDTKGLPAAGVVDRIVQDSTGIMLVLEGGQIVEPDNVTQVLSAPKTSTSTSSTATT